MQVEHFLKVAGPQLPGRDWQGYLLTKSVTYGGEMVQRAMDLSVAQVVPSLPPEGYAGIIDIMAVSAPAVQDYLRQPLASFLNLTKVAKRPRPGRVRVAQGELVPLARELLRRGMVRPSAAMSSGRSLASPCSTASSAWAKASG